MAGGYTTPQGPGQSAAAGPRPAAAPAHPAAPSPFPAFGQRPAPNGDPQYLAYLRNLNLQETTAWQRAQQANQLNSQRYQLGLSDMTRLNPIAQQNLHGGFEARGIYSSGEHALAYSRLLAQQAADRGNLTLANATAGQGVRQTLEDTLANLAAQRAQQELALQVRLSSKGLADLGSLLPTGA